MKENFGVNNANLSINEIIENDINRVEICLGREKTYEKSLDKALKAINECEKMKLNFSIHLPIYLFDWYNYDYLSAFFISKNKKLREKSFKLLKENLKRLKHLRVDYFVLHFPGINHNDINFENFEKTLNESLNRINDLAKEFNVKIYLEYFGSNILFSDYNDWINKIKNYSNLNILVDTGHLYFASKLIGFEFEDAFNTLSKTAEAFHFWTTKGNEFYMNNEYYKKYHHIVPNINQLKEDGWAFNSEEVFLKMIEKDKPIIIEASNYYKGHEYFIESIKEMINYKGILR